MKNLSSGLFVTVLFAAMLFSPKAVFNGASEGLLLWYEIIFPTLFPFLVVTSLLLAAGGLRFIAGLTGRFLCSFFCVSPNGSFAVLAGFLCGYPMGAKITADLLRSGRISQEEGSYLLSFCNNTSPVFILNFIVWKTFGREDLMLPTLLILMGVPLLLSFLFRRIYLRGRTCFSDLPDDSAGKTKRFSFSVFDSCMMDSFESIVKVGGYIILFSVLLALIRELPGDNALMPWAAPALEVTNGIRMLGENISDFRIAYPAVLALTSFGGFCSIAQTQCMLEGTGLKIIPYIIEKLAAAAAASLLAVLYLKFF